MIFFFCLNHGFQYIPFTAVSRVKTMCLSLMFLMFSHFKFRNLANRVCFYSDWYSGLNYWFLLAFFTFESQEADDFYLLALFPCIAFILKNIYSLQCHPFHSLSVKFWVFRVNIRGPFITWGLLFESC